MRLFCVGGLKVAETLPFRRSNVDGLATFLPFEGDEARLQRPCCNFVAVSLLNWHHFGDVIGLENDRGAAEALCCNFVAVSSQFRRYFAAKLASL